MYGSDEENCRFVFILRFCTGGTEIQFRQNPKLGN